MEHVLQELSQDVTAIWQFLQCSNLNVWAKNSPVSILDCTLGELVKLDPSVEHRGVIDTLFELVESSNSLVWGFTHSKEFKLLKKLGVAGSIKLFKTHASTKEILILYDDIVRLDVLDEAKYDNNDILILVIILFHCLPQNCSVYDRYPLSGSPIPEVDAYLEQAFDDEIMY